MLPYQLCLGTRCGIFCERPTWHQVSRRLEGVSLHSKPDGRRGFDSGRLRPGQEGVEGSRPHAGGLKVAEQRLQSPPATAPTVVNAIEKSPAQNARSGHDGQGSSTMSTLWGKAQEVSDKHSAARAIH
ncbi:SHE10 [Symbiodinium necroappetens]|uniref:SHE10 protein n=1 Tax=Symbiodinium necroappetens TaxID=1628268 RepID=A0A812X4M7_9DINO|nr:SHE10 [Symbiodinium necroappetens]